MGVYKYFMGMSWDYEIEAQNDWQYEVECQNEWEYEVEAQNDWIYTATVGDPRWILAHGIWDDDGIWIDTEIWRTI